MCYARSTDIVKLIMFDIYIGMTYYIHRYRHNILLVYIARIWNLDVVLNFKICHDMT